MKRIISYPLSLLVLASCVMMGVSAEEASVEINTSKNETAASEQDLYEICIPAGPENWVMSSEDQFTTFVMIDVRNDATFEIEKTSYTQYGKASVDDPYCVFSSIEWNAQTLFDGKRLFFSITMTGGDEGIDNVSFDIPQAMGISIIDSDGNQTMLHDIPTFTIQFQITTKETQEITEPTEPSNGSLILGDVNADGEIDIMDVIAANKFILGASVLNASQISAADVDSDGEITSTDSLMILKYVVNIIEAFD